MFVNISELPLTSRLWFFYDDQPWSEDISSSLSDNLHRFCTQWKNHDMDVFSSFEIFDNQILMIVADNLKTAVSGCSNDSLTHIIYQLQNKFNINLFSRKILVYQNMNNSEGDLSLELKSSYTLNDLKKMCLSTMENNTIEDIYILDTTIKLLKDKPKKLKKLEDSWIMDNWN